MKEEGNTNTMYKIHKVKIDGFWLRFTAEITFNEDVNIIIGKNGTGKTTFMDILHSILSVDFDGLNRNDFSFVEITLTKGEDDKKVINVIRIEEEGIPTSRLEYEIDGEKYPLRVISSEDRLFPLSYRRKIASEGAELKKKLSSLVSLSSLSVYRLKNYDEFDIRDKHGNYFINSVDFKLDSLMRDLSVYQLEIAQQIRSVSLDLQK